jgi:O-antigen/teichoic acid export membrane protein
MWPAMTTSAGSPVSIAGEEGGRGTVARNSLLSMVALIVLGGSRVLYGSMISRATDTETYGLVGVLTAVTLILSLVLPAGIASATTRFVPYSRGRGDMDAARRLHRLLARVGLGAALLLGLLAAGGAAYFQLGASEVAQVGILTAVYGVYVTSKAGLYGFDQVGRYARLEILGSAAILATTVAILLAGSTLYLAPLIVGYGLFVIGAHLSLRAHTGPSATAVSRTDLRELAVYAGLACIGTLASAGFLQATQLLTAQYARLSDVAFFTATITLISPLWFLPRALSLALFPFMAEAHGAGDQSVVRRHADLATRGLLALLGPLFVAGILFSRELLVLYGGAPFASGALVMQIVLAAAYLGVVQVASVNALSSASGHQLRISVAWAVMGAASGLVLVALSGEQLGATGIAIAYFMGTAITAAGPMAVVWRRYGLGWAGPMARAFGMVGLAFVVARLVEAWLGPDRSLLFDGIIAFMGATIAALVLHADIRASLRRARSRGSGGGSVEHEPLVSTATLLPHIEPSARKRS